MASAIQQLQAQALDSSCRVTDLLRRAKLVASKLDLADMERWVDFELKGYSNDAEIPEYRKINGRPCWYNPYRGWLAINFSVAGAKDAAKLSKADNYQAIGEIEDLISNSTNDSFHRPFPAELAAIVCKAMGVDPTEVTVFIGRAELVGIVDAVRSTLLEWALKLEKAGILGEDVNFTESERQAAHQPSAFYQTNNITNFAGNLGPASGNATVTTNQNIGLQADGLRDLVAMIEEQYSALRLAPPALDQLTKAVEEIKAELAKKSPEPSTLKKAISEIRNAVIGAGAKLLASGITHHLDKLPAIFGGLSQ